VNVTPPDEYVTYRLNMNRQRLWNAVNTLNELAVNACACDYLDALYQVTRFWRGRLGAATYDRACGMTANGRVVAGLTWLRGMEAHHIVTPGFARDRTAEYMYDHYLCWDWTRTPPEGAEGIRDDYVAMVAGKEIRVILDQVDEFLAGVRVYL
jgi:hypothetical protein